MEIQINTDKNIKGPIGWESYFSEELEKNLSHFEDRITRLEVYLGDENTRKSGAKDKRCLIEARPKKSNPIAVTAYSDSLVKAFQAASEKMKRTLDSTFEKMERH